MLSNAPKGWQGVDIKKLIKAEIGEQQLIGLTNLTAREGEGIGNLRRNFKK